jgi:hypothetical protein
MSRIKFAPIMDRHSVVEQDETRIIRGQRLLSGYRRLAIEGDGLLQDVWLPGEVQKPVTNSRDLVARNYRAARCRANCDKSEPSPLNFRARRRQML